MADMADEWLDLQTGRGSSDGTGEVQVACYDMCIQALIECKEIRKNLSIYYGKTNVV